MTTIHPPLFMFLIEMFGCEKKKQSYLGSLPNSLCCYCSTHFCLPACHMRTINQEPLVSYFALYRYFSACREFDFQLVGQLLFFCPMAAITGFSLPLTLKVSDESKSDESKQLKKI